MVKEHPLFIVIVIILLFGVGLVIATGSNNPPLHGHDVDEVDWSKTIPALRTNQLCMPGNCRTTWPSMTDTRCDIPGRCGQVCIGSVCRSSWAGILPEPPVCGGEQVPRWTGSGWSCVLVDIIGPLYYQCPSLTSNCVSNPCIGQRSAFNSCYSQRYTGGGFCSGCGCWQGVRISCRPVYV